MKRELLMMRTKGLAAPHFTRKAGGYTGLSRSTGSRRFLDDQTGYWFLVLDGTSYMELATPLTFSGNSELEFEISTVGGVLQDLTDGYSITAGDVFSTPAEVTDILVDGSSVGIGGPAPVDGQKHIIKFIASSMSQKQYIGGITNKFHGIIYRAKLTDLDTPSNSIEWKIDCNCVNRQTSITDPNDSSKDLILWNVAANDWLTDIVKPQYLWGTFTATSSTPADTLWRVESTDPYEVAKVGTNEYIYTTNIINQPIPMTDGDIIDWYIAEPSKLAVFNAQNNRLTGTIPSLSNNTALKDFNVYSNQLTGSIPILSNNTALIAFSIHNNQLTGTIPSLSNNTALNYFNVYNNQLTGSIPNLDNNTALINFYAYSNQLTGSIPSLSNNTALNYFSIHNNQLTDFVGGWPNIAFTFDARVNKLTVDAVNQILIDADTYGIASGTTIKLEGGTNAAPTGAGLTAKNNLIANGATVTTN